jgi:hypothetical protein
MLMVIISALFIVGFLLGFACGMNVGYGMIEDEEEMPNGDLRVRREGPDDY